MGAVMGQYSTPQTIHSIRNGDWLLFRYRDSGMDLVSGAIEVGGRSPYFHAGMAYWCEERLMCLETRQGCGAHAVNLANHLAQNPAIAVDVRHILFPHYKRTAAVGYMLDLAGKPYGWTAIKRASLGHMPIVRWFVWLLYQKQAIDDKANGSLPFCSAAVARATVAGGFDPVSHLASNYTEPGDLGRVPEELARTIGTIGSVDGRLVLDAARCTS
jgi:hypothetical protein